MLTLKGGHTCDVVGTAEGTKVGAVGVAEGCGVGAVGERVGRGVGLLGRYVGLTEGAAVGRMVGSDEGLADGGAVPCIVGLYVTTSKPSVFPPMTVLPAQVPNPMQPWTTVYVWHCCVAVKVI
jgi:hypothetical protein